MSRKYENIFFSSMLVTNTKEEIINQPKNKQALRKTKMVNLNAQLSFFATTSKTRKNN